MPQICVASIDDTIAYIIKNTASMSRFGDGELLWMLGEKQNSFQEQSEDMQSRLKEIVKSNVEGHIVCVSDYFGSLKEYNHFANRFWARHMFNYRKKWLSVLDVNKKYFNTNVTRFYMDYNDKTKSYAWAEQLKQIWNGREICIIEGEFTRLGVGNDLFDGAKDIKRILAPNVNAYSVYNDILNYIIHNVANDKLLLIALGPTATILAFDLHKIGYQALDVGHVDVEYEWMRMRAKTKIPLPNKYVNEAPNGEGRINEDYADDKYASQIMTRIGC